MYSDVGDELCNTEVDYVRVLFERSVLAFPNRPPYEKLYSLWQAVPDEIKSDWFSTLWNFDIRDYTVNDQTLGHPEHTYELTLVIYNLSQRVLEKIKEYITTDEFQNSL